MNIIVSFDELLIIGIYEWLELHMIADFKLFNSPELGLLRNRTSLLLDKL